MTIKFTSVEAGSTPAAGGTPSGPGKPAVFGEKPRSAAGYKGPERRRKHRRGHTDRREEMRFDLDKTDRRVLAGRRSGDKQVKFW
jgi:hypothetical protein